MPLETYPLDFIETDLPVALAKQRDALPKLATFGRVALVITGDRWSLEWGAETAYARHAQSALTVVVCARDTDNDCRYLAGVLLGQLERVGVAA